MSTSNRPTFHPAIGPTSLSGLGNVSRHMSAKDQPAETKLKFRQSGQSTQDDMRTKDLRSELEERERVHLASKKTAIAMIEKEEQSVDVVKLLTDKPDMSRVAAKYNDADIEGNGSDKDFDSSSEEDDDDDEDDEEELQRELVRIKAERAVAAAKKQAEEEEQELRMKTDVAIKGNPLLDLDGADSSKIKRKWNDDVVFRNQTRGEPEQKKRSFRDVTCINSSFATSALTTSGLGLDIPQIASSGPVDCLFTCRLPSSKSILMFNVLHISKVNLEAKRIFLIHKIVQTKGDFSRHKLSNFHQTPSRLNLYEIIVDIIGNSSQCPKHYAVYANNIAPGQWSSYDRLT
eukprot:gene10259-21404_t